MMLRRLWMNSKQASEKLKASGIMGIAISGTGAWSIAPYFLSLGGKFTDNNNTKATGYLNRPTSVKALEKIVE
jgi:multiple sugar transport system substrate-binding protein